MFRGPFEHEAYYRFAVLICFDWITTVSGERPWRTIVQEMAEEAARLKADLSLSWLFVIQHNPKPSHHSFMTEVNQFFDHSANRSVRRDRTCLVFANSAALGHPGKADQFGRTSVIFSEQTSFQMPDCYATFCSGGSRFRGHDIVHPHKDFLFRENGSCVHSFQQLNPDIAVPGPAGRSIALRHPFVHPNGDRTDPRTPANLVPASVKWINDELDTVPNLAERYRDAPLSPSVRRHCAHAIDEFRQFSGTAVEFAIELASPDVRARRRFDGSSLTADDWAQPQVDAIGHVLHTVSILGLCSPTSTIEPWSRHVTVSISDAQVDVIAIRAETHEACREHLTNLLPAGRNPVLLVSRDEDNLDFFERLSPFTEPVVQKVPFERDFTNPQEIASQLGYSDLLRIFRQSDTTEQAREALNVRLCL